MAKASGFNPQSSPNIGDIYTYGSATYMFTTRGWAVVPIMSGLVVTSANLANASVLTQILADACVTANKLAVDSVTSGKIADNNIITSKIADGNVTTAKLADGAVTKAKITDVYSASLVGAVADLLYIVGNWRGTTGTGVFLSGAGLVDVKVTTDTDYAVGVRNTANARTGGIKGNGSFVGVDAAFTGTITTENLTVNNTGVAQWAGTPTSGAHLTNKSYVDSFTKVGSTVIGQGVGAASSPVTWAANVGNIFFDAGPQNGSRVIRLANGTPGTWVAHATLAGGTVVGGSITTSGGLIVGTAAFTITATRIA